VRRFDVESIKEQAVASSRPALRALSIAVGVLLLIVCANVAGLLLARGLSRQREVAVRLALGAGRGRVMRQLLTESGILAVAGGALGVLVAAAAVHALRVVASPNAEGPFLISFGGAMVPRLHEVSIDLSVLGIAAATSALTAIIVGVVPSLVLLWTKHGRGAPLLGGGSAQRGPVPMEQLVMSSLTRQRFYAGVMGVFAACAAALSAIGLYGVLAYGVARRTAEIGLRMALGAEAGAIRRLILRRGMGLFAAGLLVGLGGAAVLARLLGSMLYGVTPLDPATYVSAAGLFSLIVTLACWVPARRATRVDPMVALRRE